MAALREIFARFDVEFDPSHNLQRGDKAVKRTTADIERLDREARKSGQGLQRLGAGARQAERGLGALGSSLKGALAAIGIGAAVRGLWQFVDAATQAADAIDKLSQQIGFTASDLQEFQLAAELGGVNARAFSRSIRQLQQRAFQAAHGTASMRRQFELLGVSVERADGSLKTGRQLFEDVARALTQLDNPTERVAQAQLLMGESGARLLPMMRDVAGGGDRLRRELERLGGGYSADAIRRSVEFRDALTRQKVAMDSVKSAILEQFGPALVSLVEKTTEFVTLLSGIVKHSHAAEVALVALATAAGVFALATIGIWGPIVGTIAIIAGLVAIVDDLWVTFEGGDSVLRRILNDFLGFERAQQVVDNARQAVDDLVAALRAADRWFGGFVLAVERTYRVMTHEPSATRPHYGNVTPADRAAATHNTVNVSSPVHVEVHGATNPEEVGRVVDQRLREHADRQARQLQAALVPGGAS